MYSMPKRQKTYAMGKKIGTHNGTFHCDEALACYMLKTLPEYTSAEVIRTRDEKLLDTCDIVVDVGGIYDHDKNRYDHHQRTFDGTMQSLGSLNYQTKLSSAGLIYLHYGRRVITEIANRELDSNVLNVIYDKVYENFLEEIDAIDNGISQTEETARYLITTGVSARVSHLNPAWNCKQPLPDKEFVKAMDLVGSELRDKILYFCNVWYPAREIVEAAVKTRHQIHESGEIILLENGGCPWKEHLYVIEQKLQTNPTLKYVLYSDQNNNWRVQCVPERHKRFENRLSLPQNWRGLREADLSNESGIKDCIFVHMGGFIGGNKTKEGALEMAIKALQFR
ncbi:UPF0160 protein C27H6.8 [Trichoplax sp. H2]|nr:UPF0160 protein C27H6.8 [Trichoplax sp. H2]|eukprot:RDD39169.1 UPF0160 protein C27H6.8 [Trichoplax sp. H2]